MNQGIKALIAVLILTGLGVGIYFLIKHFQSSGSKPSPQPGPAPPSPGPQKVDCAYTWSDWSDCMDGSCTTQKGGGCSTPSCLPAGKNTGKQFRELTITQQPENGGAECPTVTEQSRSCTVPACDQDCEYTWSDWGPCMDCSSGTCVAKDCLLDGGTGKQTRTLTITQQPTGKGKACPTVTTDSKDCTIKECSADCVWHLSDPSPCYTSDCDGTDLSKCTLAPSCVKGSGVGKSFRKVVIDQPPRGYGGKPCPTSPEVDQCQIPGCPEDCTWHWSGWSDCYTQPCDGSNIGACTQAPPCSPGGSEGVQFRSVVVDTPAKFGGKCSSQPDSKGCLINPCQCTTTPPASLPCSVSGTQNSDGTWSYAVCNSDTKNLWECRKGCPPAPPSSLNCDPNQTVYCTAESGYEWQCGAKSTPYCGSSGQTPPCDENDRVCLNMPGTGWGWQCLSQLNRDQIKNMYGWVYVTYKNKDTNQGVDILCKQLDQNGACILPLWPTTLGDNCSSDPNSWYADFDQTFLKNVVQNPSGHIYNSDISNLTFVPGPEEMSDSTNYSGRLYYLAEKQDIPNHVYADKFCPLANPCQNGGTYVQDVMNQSKTGKCECTNSSQGFPYDPATDCADVICPSEGHWVKKDANTCVCDTNWTGSDCNTQVCSDLQMKSGYWKPVNSTCTCTCATNCQTDENNTQCCNLVSVYPKPVWDCKTLPNKG